MGNLTESIQNVISLHTDRNVVLNKATLGSVRVEEIDVLNRLNANNGIFNNVRVNTNIDISNNTTANIGNFTTLNVNNLTSPTGLLRNIRSTDISSNTILAESGTFRNITSENINSSKYTINTLNINKICFDPTDATKCLSLDTIRSLTNIDNYNPNNIKNQYMYYPNILPRIVMSESNSNTYNNNIIWSAPLSQYIDLTANGTGRLDKIGKLRAVGLNEGWKYLNGTTETVYTALTVASAITSSTSFITSSLNAAQSNGIGMEITVPLIPINNPTGDYSVLWILTSTNTLWYTLKLYQYANNSVIKYFGKFSDGKNNLNKISPDGSTHDNAYDSTIWIPIPFDLNGNTTRKLLLSSFHTAGTNEFRYIKQIAFSTNPWNHCRLSSHSIYNTINDSDTSQGLTPNTTNMIIFNNNTEAVWNNTRLCYFKEGLITQFRIPFVNSGKDKIFYIVEHNNNWGPGIIGLSILKSTPNTSTEVEINLGNFYTSFDNPFSRHFNSKMYQRYYGIVIPKEHLPVKGTSSDNFIKLKISIPSSPAGYGLYFTEVGTHDKNSFD